MSAAPEPANDDTPTAPEASMRLFVFGGGYSARHLLEGLEANALEGVTTRSAEKAAGFAARGLTPFLFDGERPGEGIDAALHRATHLLISAPPGHAAPDGASAGGANARLGDPVLRWYRDEIVHSTPGLAWIGYLSTVGVYGDHGGEWVDEESEPAPVSERSRQRLATERAWQDVAAERGVPLAILRLSGIYGPGRNAFVNLREGTARRLVKPGQVFNRIHAEDIAGAARFLMERSLGGVFNVTDDEPGPPQDVVAAAAAMAGIKPPPEMNFDQAELSSMARSFYGENKRVSNRRLKAAGYVFRYPTYREGLADLQQEFAPEGEKGGR